ncbi:1,4-dihydroxy-2-naphthoyl-CoA hydrolase [Planktothrix sp. PCC 11201]|uniref:acyl-CoA thioesterase n=1 Tax=Planktothrix sp. PCC 11201 TaxID=1729650 RepID=UPI0009180E18|nr:1,4-dihydroxy-2-naphthoyl-CoA hydrolase [Planktothrix sp. PCC 11201]
MTDLRYIYKRTIRFQDTDAAGVVYFANILAMGHEAYEASLNQAEINLKSFFVNPDFAMPIVHASVDFRFPLFCGDQILIRLNPEIINENSFKIQYEIRLDNSDQLIAEAITKHICIAPKTRQRQPLPPEIINWLEKASQDI